MKDYFNWIGCKSSKKERYIQPLPIGVEQRSGCKSSKKERYIQLRIGYSTMTIGCKSSKKERYIQPSSPSCLSLPDVNHLKKKGISNQQKNH